MLWGGVCFNPAVWASKESTGALFCLCQPSANWLLHTSLHHKRRHHMGSGSLEQFRLHKACLLFRSCIGQCWQVSVHLMVSICHWWGA